MFGSNGSNRNTIIYICIVCVNALRHIVFIFLRNRYGVKEWILTLDLQRNKLIRITGQHVAITWEWASD